MAEGSSASEANEVVIPLKEETSAQTNQEEAVKPRNEDPVLKRLSEEKASLKAQLAEKDSRLKELERGTMDDSQYVDAELKDLTAERILSSLDKEALARMPQALREKIERDPFSLVSEDDLQRGTNTSTAKSSKREFYKAVQEVASRSLGELLKDFKTPQTTDQNSNEQSDPTLVVPSGSRENPAAYTEAQLFVMAQEDPTKFAKVMSSTRGK